MKKLFSVVSALLLVACAAVSSRAATVEFSYYNESDIVLYGSNEPEKYDVAIFVNEPALVGKKVTGISAYIPAPDYFEGVTAWLSTSLSLKNMANYPNICEVPVEVNGNMLTVTFPEPYEITAAGFYAGYSFTISKVKDSLGRPVNGAGYPIAIFEDAVPGSLYIHSSKSFGKWTDVNALTEYGCYMFVNIEGDFAQASVATETKTFIATANEDSESYMNIVNVGSEPISSMDYSYTFGTESKSFHVDFEQPICPYYGMAGEVTVKLPTFAEAGNYNITMSIDKVNGIENENENKSVDCPIIVGTFKPVYRPLVEEYTGLWCPWCPRGYVAMEEMNELYGDDFVGLAYHADDDMQVVSYFPSAVSSFPFSYINRSVGIDPSKISKVWNTQIRENTFAEVEATIEWADEEHKTVRCTSKSRFIADFPNSNYAVGYILTADGMHNDEWEQMNGYYSYPVNYYPGKFWQLFLGQPLNLKGLYFNDVVAHCSPYTGIVGSIPADVKMNEEYTHVYDIPVEKIGTMRNSNPFTNYGLMRVVAVIVDRKTGTPVNCVKSDYLDYVGAVESPAEENADVVSTVCYDICGNMIEEPAKGLFIKVETLENGETRVKKLMK